MFKSILFDGSHTTWGSDTGPYQDTALNNAGGNTLTVLQTINGIVRRTGGGAQTDTLPTAAALVGAIPGCQVGSAFDFVVINNSGGTHTLGLGTGVTAAANVTTTLTTTAANAHYFVMIVTNVNSPAITIYSLGQSAS